MDLLTRSVMVPPTQRVMGQPRTQRATATLPISLTDSQTLVMATPLGTALATTVVACGVRATDLWAVVAVPASADRVSVAAAVVLVAIVPVATAERTISLPLTVRSQPRLTPQIALLR